MTGALQDNTRLTSCLKQQQPQRQHTCPEGEHSPEGQRAAAGSPQRSPAPALSARSPQPEGSRAREGSAGRAAPQRAHPDPLRDAYGLKDHQGSQPRHSPNRRSPPGPARGWGRGSEPARARLPSAILGRGDPPRDPLPSRRRQPRLPPFGNDPSSRRSPHAAASPNSPAPPRPGPGGRQAAMEEHRPLPPRRAPPSPLGGKCATGAAPRTRRPSPLLPLAFGWGPGPARRPRAVHPGMCSSRRAAARWGKRGGRRGRTALPVSLLGAESQFP